MSNQVTYTVTVDSKMFPYPPGSEVVVRKNKKRLWMQEDQEWFFDTFLSMTSPLSGRTPPAYLCLEDDWDECHPLATHGHLLGTTYSADTPACAKCGKPALKVERPRYEDPVHSYANGQIVCEKCFASGTMQPAITTADGVTVKEGDVVWLPDGLKMTVVDGRAEDHAVSLPVSDCYSRPCARIADGSVKMVGDKVWHPSYGECTIKAHSTGTLYALGKGHAMLGVRPRHCYPIGSRVMTPDELEAGQSELDDWVDRAKAWEAVARTLANSPRLNMGDPTLMFKDELRKLTAPI